MSNSGSKSTDKLEILMEGLSKWPPECFSRIKSVSITWDALENPTDEGGLYVPNLTMEFYDEKPTQTTVV